MDLGKEQVRKYSSMPRVTLRTDGLTACICLDCLDGFLPSSWRQVYLQIRFDSCFTMRMLLRMSHRRSLTTWI